MRTAVAEVGNGPKKYTDWFGMSGQPWCAMFASWCASSAGIMSIADSAPYPSVKKTASVKEMYNFFVASRRNLTPSMTTTSPNYPKVGDIAFINGTDEHVGIIVEVSGAIVKTVEGNTNMPGGGNGVSYQTYTNLENGPSYKLTHIGSNSKKLLSTPCVTLSAENAF